MLVVCDILVNIFCPAQTNEPLISLAYYGKATLPAPLTARLGALAERSH